MSRFSKLFHARPRSPLTAVTINIPDDLAELLDEEAKKRGIPRATLCAQYVSKGFWSDAWDYEAWRVLKALEEMGKTF